MNTPTASETAKSIQGSLSDIGGVLIGAISLLTTTACMAREKGLFRARWCLCLGQSTSPTRFPERCSCLVESCGAARCRADGDTLGAHERNGKWHCVMWCTFSSGWFTGVSQWLGCAGRCVFLILKRFALIGGFRDTILNAQKTLVNASITCTVLENPRVCTPDHRRQMQIAHLSSSGIFRPVLMFSISPACALNVTRLPAAAVDDASTKGRSTSAMIWKPMPHMWPLSLRDRTCFLAMIRQSIAQPCISHPLRTWPLMDLTYRYIQWWCCNFFSSRLHHNLH